MTRAAFLPFTGDCFLFREWMRLYNSIWGSEVDHLYIMLNANIPPDAKQYVYDLIKDPITPITLIAAPSALDHGPAIDRLLTICEEDLVMLIEEDAFIFKEEAVNECFERIESGEIEMIGSPRGSCAEEIWKAENTKWPNTPEQAPNFWPNFLFVKKSDLLRTDRNFSAKAWHKGDVIPYIDHVVEDEVVYGDTFVWASIQLRGLGLRVGLVDQYHSRVEDIEHKDRYEGIFDPKCPWIHIGSLSGWQHLLLRDVLDPRIGEIEEYERRAGAWLMFWEDAQETLPEYIKDYSQRYKAGIGRLITDYTLSDARTALRGNLFRYLLNPELYAKRQITII